MKLSHSSINKYSQCGHSYKLRYVDRIVSRTKGSALYFGTAIDAGLNILLTEQNLEKALKTFEDNWIKQKDNSYQEVELCYNLDIKYSKKDLDEDLFSDKDLEWISSISPALELTPDQIHQYKCWISLLRKGQMFIEAYNEQIIPKIKNVLVIQKEINLDNGTGDKINGFVDLVAELHDYPGLNIVFDNKTASVAYDEENSVQESDQLAKYMLILNELALQPDSGWTHPIHKAGYIVLDKNVNKEITKKCQSCGHIATGSHKKCDNLVDGKRCNENWEVTKKLSINTQFIVGDISEHFQDVVLENVNEVHKSITAGVFPKNFNSCINKYHQKCDYYDLCRSGKMDSLIKLDKKDK